MCTIPEEARLGFRIQFLQHRRHGLGKPPPATDRPKPVEARSDEKEDDRLIEFRGLAAAYNLFQFMHAEYSPSDRKSYPNLTSGGKSGTPRRPESRSTASRAYR